MNSNPKKGENSNFEYVFCYVVSLMTLVFKISNRKKSRKRKAQGLIKIGLGISEIKLQQHKKNR